MGLVKGLNKPQILSFFTQEADFFAHAVMDFAKSRDDDFLELGQCPKGRGGRYGRFYSPCLFFCLWTNDAWQTYPLRIYDSENNVLFRGKHIHGHAPNGNGIRRIVTDEGYEPGSDLDGVVIDLVFEKNFKSADLFQVERPALTGS